MALDLGVAQGHIDLDLTNFTTTCTSAVREVEKLDKAYALSESSLRKAETGSKGAAGAFQQSAEKSKHLSNELQNAKQKAELYEQGISGLNTVIQRSAQEQGTLKQKIADVTEQHQKAEQKAKGLEDAYKAATKEAQAIAKAHGEDSEQAKSAAKAQEEAGAAYEKAQGKSEEYRNELLQLGSRYDELGIDIDGSKGKLAEYQTSLNNTEADIADISRELDEARSRLANFGTAMQQTGDKLQTVGNKISGIGGAMSMAVTTPLLAAGTASVKFATDAETSFAKVGTIADSAVLSYDRMKSGVISASNESGIAVTDFNEALYSSISAGVESGDAISFTSDMVKLAKGGFTDTAKAVDVVTTVLNAYDLEADQATAISDKLITAQNLGKTTVDELAASMGKVIPTANSVNIGIDDVAAAMATLTKNGIATAEATTYYNSMLNELGKSGSTADAALKEIAGKSFKDLVAEGKPVTEILQMLSDNAANSGLSLSDMFGSAEASKAALTIMKGSGDEYNDILRQMKDSAGATQTAFEKMDSAPAAQMQKELNKLKNAGIDVGNKLLPLVTKGVEFIGDLADAYNDLSPAQQDNIIKMGLMAAAAGPVLKVTGTLTSGLGKVTGGLGKLAESAGKKGAAKGLSEAATSGGGLKSVLGLIPGPAKLALGAAALAGAGIAAAMYQAHKAAVEADLESHFGDIKLSAEDVEDVATRITTTDWTVRLNAYMDAKGQLEQYESTLKETVDQLNKLDWKMSVGLELTEEEKENYRQSASDYVAQCQDYMQQQNYTMDLAIKASFSADSSVGAGLAAFTNTYYANSQEELTSLGTQLADLVNDSFSNNTFAKNRVQIEKIRQQMAEITQELNRYEAEATNTQFVMSLNNMDVRMDAESFQRVNEKINQQVDEVTKNAEEANKDTLVAINMRYDAMIEAGVSKEVADKFKTQAIDELQSDLAASESEVRLEGVHFALDELNQNYKEELAVATPEFTKTLEENLSSSIETANVSGTWGTFFEGMAQDLEKGADGLGNESKENIGKMLDSMGDQPEALQSLANKFLEAGQTVPENISKGLSDVYQMQAMTGNVDNIYSYIGMQLGNSPEYMSMIEKAIQSGVTMPEGFVEGIEMSSGKVYDANTQTFVEAKQAVDDQLPAVLEYMNMAGTDIAGDVAQGMIAQYGLVSSAGEWLVLKTQEGGASVLPTTLSAFSQSGIDIPQAFVTALDGQSAEVHTRAAELINQLSYATEEERPGIISELEGLGGDGAVELANSITAKQTDTDAAVRALLQLIPGATAEEKEGILSDLHALGIDLADAQITGIESGSTELEGAARDSARNTVEGYRQGIESNKGSSTTMVGTWSKEIAQKFMEGLGIHSPSTVFDAAGVDTVQGYTQGVTREKEKSLTTVSTWLTEIKGKITEAQLPAYTETVGKSTGTKLGAGIVSGAKAQNQAVYNSAAGLGQQANYGLNSVNTDTYIWGYHFGQGLYNGINAWVGSIVGQGAAIAAGLAANLHFTRPDIGPLRDYETWMPHMVQGLSRTLRDSAPALEAQGVRTAAMLARSMRIDTDTLHKAYSDAADIAGSISLFGENNVLRVQHEYKNEAALMEQLSRMERELSQIREKVESLDSDDMVNGITGALKGVKVEHTTTLNGKVLAQETAPLINRQFGERSELDRRQA